jgi:hypothetical protein
MQFTRTRLRNIVDKDTTKKCHWEGKKLVEKNAVKKNTIEKDASKSINEI